MENVLDILVNAFKNNNWCKARDLLDNNTELKYEITGSCLTRNLLLYGPPLDILLKCISSNNVSLELIRYAWDNICFCHEERCHVLETVLEHFRPSHLAMKPMVLTNKEGEHYFTLELFSSCSKLKQLNVSVPALAAATYMHLKEAGFPSTGLEQRCVSGSLGLDNNLSKEMMVVCQEDSKRIPQLQDLCRNGIRDSINTLKPNDFEHLHLPRLIKKYLMLHDVQVD